jgi:concentrative nucleoside transporter, CNT family
MADSIHALAGIAGLLALAWLASEERRAVPWRAIAAGLGLQLLLAVVFLKIPAVKELFLKLNDVLLVLERATQAGTGLVFGYLGGGAAPFEVSQQGSMFILAFRALPIVLVVSALSALLFYWRVLPAVVRAISWLLERSMGVGGVVGLSTAANVFVGMVEAPLFVRPYLARVSRGELFAIMVGGMASIAGTVLFLYGAILGPVLPDAVAHLLIASILSAPAALVIAFLMVPPRTTTGGEVIFRSEASSSMDALTRGTLDGAQLLLNIVAMLVVFVALVALVNFVIAPYTLQGLLGWALAPLAWLAGISWSEAQAAGALLGTKTVINELVAYVELAKMSELSERSRVLMTYALCGFANFGSLGIMLGGLGTMCPERRGEVVALGMKSIVAGTLATCLTAATVALIL